MIILRCDALILGSFSDLCWLLVFGDKRGEAFTEKERREAARVEPREDTERPHDGALITPEEGNCRSDEFEARRNEDAGVEGLDVFPTTVTGSILNARNGTRSAALMPKRRPPDREKKPKEKRKGLIGLVGVSGLNSSYDLCRLREIFHGSRRQSASTLHVIPRSIDQPITDVIVILVLNQLKDGIGR